jgi:putative transposase
MIRRWSFRIYPTPQQEEILSKTFGCCRYVYNWALQERTKAYQSGIKMSHAQVDLAMTQLKKRPEFAWLREVSATPLQQSLRHLQTAFLNFFEKRTKYPTFHKRGRKDSATYTRCAFRFEVDNQRLFLAKMDDPIKVNFSRKVDQIPTTVTISRTASGKYFASFVVDVAVPIVPKTGQEVGIDFGLSRLATLSTGERVANPRHGNRHRAKLKRAQQNVSRKYEARKARKKTAENPKEVRMSNRERRARKKVAIIHEKIANCRNDKLQKFTTDLVRRFDLICVEDLNLRGMVKNHSLARSLYDVGIGMAVRMLENKAAAADKTVVKVDRFFPSTKLCSNCGHLLNEIGLDVREWECPTCKAHHDRDENAAFNILAAGQAVAAHGDGVRLARVSIRESFRRRSANPQAISSE